MRSLTGTLFVGGLLTFSGCIFGDCGEGDSSADAMNATDGAAVDAAVDGAIAIDAGVDAPADAAGPRAWGTAVLIEADNTGGGNDPQVAVDSNGNATAVWWHSATNGRHNVRVNRFVASSGWGTDALLEHDDAGYAIYPRAAVDPSGNVTAVWQQSGGGNASIYSRRFVPASGWGAATIVETDNGDLAQYPEVAVDASGNAIAVWKHADDTWSNRFVPGTGWGPAGAIETDEAGSADFPQVAVDAAGNATAVWRQSDGTRANVWANRYVSGSGWGTATLIETANAGIAMDPKVAVDLAGNATAVWHQHDGTRFSIWSNRFVAGSGWGSATLIETNDTGAATFPQIAVDPAGNAIAVWAHAVGTVGSRDDLWANRYVPGTGWGTPTLIATSNAGSAYAPQIAVAASGEAVAVWEQLDGTRTDLWANHFVPASGWGTATLIETSDAGSATTAQIALDSAGNATAVWSQSDGTRTNIWANAFR